jgi:hypothetical protein
LPKEKLKIKKFEKEVILAVFFRQIRVVGFFWVSQK